MERLRAADLRCLLQVLGDLARADVNADFPGQALAAVAALVQGDHSAYNEIDPVRPQAVVVADPPEILWPGGEEILARHACDNPLIRHYQTAADGSPRKFSDFISQDELHRLPLYNLVYRELGIEHQMAFMLAATPVIGISINRGRSDFSERDRAILEALRPHLRRAYEVWSTVNTLAGALDAHGNATILLRRSGEFLLATDQAQRWLRDYFGEPCGWNGALPEPVAGWLRRRRDNHAGADDVPMAVGALVVSHPSAPNNANQLRMHLARDTQRDQDFVVLSEQMAMPATPALSPRELDVLREAAKGLTDAKIANALAVSHRTVNGHLQLIYRKLRVSNRSAAIARTAQLGLLSGE